MAITVLDFEVVHASTNLEAVNTIAEVPDAVIASALGENEGVTACATPELISLQAPKRGIDGRGLNTSEGFVVFAGSYARDSNATSIGEASARARQRLMDTDVMADNNKGQLVFKRDHLFSSPSSAATSVLGRRANG